MTVSGVHHSVWTVWESIRYAFYSSISVIPCGINCLSYLLHVIYSATVPYIPLYLLFHTTVSSNLLSLPHTRTDTLSLYPSPTHTDALSSLRTSSSSSTYFHSNSLTLLLSHTLSLPQTLTYLLSLSYLFPL